MDGALEREASLCLGTNDAGIVLHVAPVSSWNSRFAPSTRTVPWIWPRVPTVKSWKGSWPSCSFAESEMARAADFLAHWDFRCPYSPQ